MENKMIFKRSEAVVKRIIELHNLNIGLKDKVERFYEFCPELDDYYYGTIVTIFENALPLVKGVQLTTSKINSDTEYEITMSIRMPYKEALSMEVQMAWLRVMGICGGFALQPWYTSKSTAPSLTEGQQNLWEIYIKELSEAGKLEEYNLSLSELGSICGFWVYPVEYGVTINKPNGTREWNEATGIILGKYTK